MPGVCPGGGDVEASIWLIHYQKLLLFLFSAFNSLLLCSADHGRNTNFLYTKSFVLYSPANDPRPQMILIPEMTAYKPANDPAGKRGMAWSLFLGISNFRIAVKPLQSSLKSALPSHLSHGDSRKKKLPVLNYSQSFSNFLLMTSVLSSRTSSTIGKLKYRI